jgi:hypothetical protein
MRRHPQPATTRRPAREGLVTAMIGSALVTAAEQGAEKVRELPMPPWAFGVLTIVTFAVLLGITWSFRSVGNRH